VLLEGGLDAPFPLANYPLVRAHTPDKQIIALYNDLVVAIDGRRAGPDRHCQREELRDRGACRQGGLGSYQYEVRDCRGQLVKSGDVRLAKGLVQLDVPVSGIVALERLQ
jgi:hypothetical protein